MAGVTVPSGVVEGQHALVVRVRRAPFEYEINRFSAPVTLLLVRFPHQADRTREPLRHNILLLNDILDATALVGDGSY
jgi:hypothetical protein